MPERVDFRFDGLMASEHLMDFYEAGRFQYGAARLMVKLDQFRQSGRFSQKITSGNYSTIALATQREGSYLIPTLAPLASQIVDAFISAPISLLWSYVIDRVLKPANEDNLKQSLATQSDLLRVFRDSIEAKGEENRRTLDLLEDRIAKGDELNYENRELHERLMAETERRAYLEGNADMLMKISIEQDTKLISMAAPLIKDMGITLRRSASSLQVVSDGETGPRRLMYLNRQMASEIETSLVDDDSTLLLVKIVQYNTETGWGKLRMVEHEGLLSYNVPSDVKGRLQPELTAAMNSEETYIECVFVRSTRGIRQRAIILAIRDLGELEGD